MTTSTTIQPTTDTRNALSLIEAEMQRLSSLAVEHQDKERMMTDKELCEQINAELSDDWNTFEPMGDGVSVQGYQNGGHYGVVGSGKSWRVVFAEDATPIDNQTHTQWWYAVEFAEGQE